MQMQLDFHNTNRLQGQELEQAKAKARTQQEIIYDIFKENPNKLFCPDDIHNMISSGQPITSTRRAITNLKNEGELIKTNIMRTGSYGKPTHCYQLNTLFNQIKIY